MNSFGGSGRLDDIIGPMRPSDRAADAPPDAFETLAVHAGAEPDEITGAVAPPIYQTSTYAQDGVNRPGRGYDYARSVNPTRERLERAVAALERGTHGIAFSSGSAATAAIAQLAASDEEIVVGDDVYGGTYRYLERVHRPGGAATARYADLDAGTDVLWEELSERTRLVWFETPTNPTLKLTDIAAAARTIRERAEQSRSDRPLLVVDNTFASPALQNPLELGADIVFHSATKYLGGHSDTILGIAATRDDVVAERLRFLQNAMGCIPGPLDCFLVLRGLRTLHVRVERHVANATAVARFLAGRDDVERVFYPGLADGPHAHPGAALVGEGRQLRGGGGMVPSLPKGGETRAIAIAEGTRLFTLAESLGGVESLIEIPATMTHASVVGSKLEVDPALVRLSVGIEHVDDLVADLRQALDRA
jgi:cystathionine beta-lyase/cystathionine gamma-synthase